MSYNYEDFGPEEETIMRKRATELEYLKWFRINADFGPADSDVIDMLNQQFMKETGMNLPEGWNYAQDNETIIDK